jgi:hypothetical protein
MDYRDDSPLQSELQSQIEDLRSDLFERSPYTLAQKLRAPSVYLSRQITAQLVCYQKLVEITNSVAGSIVECGVFRGMGLMAYSNLIAALEPYNYQCKVLGFDTFEGDVGVSEIDFAEGAVVDRDKFVYRSESLEHLKKVSKLFDMDRPLAHLPKIDFIKGDISITAGKFLDSNPQHLTRILHLSMNLYNPTLSALKSFYPTMPSGGALVIHGLNFTTGATAAVRKYFDSLSSIKIRAFDFCPNFTYIIKE